MTWLVPEAQRRPTPNKWAAGSAKVQPVEGIVYHYTAGAFEGAVRWLTSLDSHASAHFVISKAGLIVQLAELEDRTWHAGGLKNRPTRFLGRPWVNSRTWGIEIENMGPLKEPPAVPATLWDAYTEAQIAAVEALTRELVARMPNAQAVCAEPERYLVGHEHVDPARKRDPGPAFPWARIYGAVRGGVCRAG